MTKQEAAIVAAYTGYMIGAFSDMHEYIEKIMGRSIWTHEMANPELMEKIQLKAKEDFIKLKVE